jgi:hypothetical protein
MKVYFEQRGGIAGIRRSISIDSNSLVREEASKLIRLIEDAKFFNLPPQFSAPSRGADYFNYKVTVEANDNRSHSIETTDRAMPPSMEPLIEYLRQKAARKE